MSRLHGILRIALVTAVVLWFAAAASFADGPRTMAPARSTAVHSRVVKDAVVLFKDAVVEAACAQRSCRAQIGRASLHVVGAVTRLLDRLGALEITIQDGPAAERPPGGR